MMQRPALYTCTQIGECTHILMHNFEAKYMNMHLCDVVYGTSSAMVPIRLIQSIMSSIGLEPGR